METILKFIKKIGDFFTGLFNVASYNDQQDKVNKVLNNIAEEMKNITSGLNNNTTATNGLTSRIGTLEQEISKVKDGLQIELFGSLQVLHAKLMDQHFATVEQKREAELYYTQIHNLGKDGWSEKYYKEIIEMPESREEYWKTINNG